MQIKQRDARKLNLKQQGLLKSDLFGRGKNAVLKSIQQLSYLQIDTISVVQRSHEHILSNRVSNFSPEMLSEHLASRKLFEYWGHAAAYLPIENYRFYQPVMQGFAQSRSVDKKLAAKILRRIRVEGPLQSKDFEDTRKSKTGGWWEWKPAKQVLEHLFLSGKLMVSRRAGFQKVFDLPENVLPASLDTTFPKTEQWCEFLILSMVNALGIATEYDLGYARSTIWQLSKHDLKQPLKEVVNQLTEDKRLTRVTIAGQPYLSTVELLEQLPIKVTRREVIAISPFDNLIINRRRSMNLFNFDYQLECYVPAAKRKYGYFALPLLWGDELIGRMDCKADRKNNNLTIRYLALDAIHSTTVTDKLISALASGIARLALSNKCSMITVERCSPNSLTKPLIRTVNGIIETSRRSPNAQLIKGNPA